MATTKFNVGRLNSEQVVDPLLSIEQIKRYLQRLHVRLGVDVGPLPIKGYAVAALPDATDWGDTASFSSLIYVYDEAGGATLAFSDGTNWLRVQDRAIVS